MKEGGSRFVDACVRAGLVWSEFPCIDAGPWSLKLVSGCIPLVEGGSEFAS